MRLGNLFSVLMLFVCVTLVSNSMVEAQSLKPIEPQQQSASPSQGVTQVGQPAQKNAKPYKLTSRVHLQKGTNKGYLVVKVELPKGSHIYSLTQKGDARPTKLTATESKQFRLIGGFSADRAPLTQNDPQLKQVVEKHKDVVQFFAPIEMASGVDLNNFKTEVKFSGQVCTAQNFCMPIMGDKISGKFAGYFERTASNQGITTGQKTTQPKPNTNGSLNR